MKSDGFSKVVRAAQDGQSRTLREHAFARIHDRQVPPGLTREEYIRHPEVTRALNIYLRRRVGELTRIYTG